MLHLPFNTSCVKLTYQELSINTHGFFCVPADEEGSNSVLQKKVEELEDWKKEQEEEVRKRRRQEDEEMEYVRRLEMEDRVKKRYRQGEYSLSSRHRY